MNLKEKTQDEKDFDEAFRSKGGIAKSDCSHFLNNLKGVIRFLISARPGGLPQVNLNVIRNASIGAYATTVGKKHFIGINEGTYTIIFSLFSRMLSSPKILTNLGDTSKEIDIPKAYDVHTLSEWEAIAEYKTPVLPQDIARKAAVVALTDLAMITLLIHEYAHIINGHTRYLNSLNSSLEINELVSLYGDLTEHEAMILQTLEMDADAYACQKGAFIFIYNWENGNISSYLKKSIKTIYDCLYLLAFVNYSVWRLFGLDEYKVEYLKRYSHPPPGIRQQLYLTLLNQIYSNHKDIGDISQMCFKAVRDCEEGFAEISERNILYKGVKFASLPECITHGSDIIKNWANVKPLLLRFADNGLT